MATFTTKTTGDSLLEKPLMEWESAVLFGIDPLCPPEILQTLVLLDVNHLDSQGEKRTGQIVIHKDLAQELLGLFEFMLQNNFPVAMIRPVSDPAFFSGGRPCDAISMRMNNSSGFNYRFISGTNRLSWHALGMAVDINPLWNPCFTAHGIEPSEGKYIPERLGTLSSKHPVVEAFLDQGWVWGGNWKQIQDYHHFEKPLQQMQF